MQEHVRVSGLVQGVGFRPFVWHLARALGLTGWVRNDAGGVECVVDGTDLQLQHFRQRLRSNAPPLARVDRIDVTPVSHPARLTDFSILKSESGAVSTMIGVDTATCPECLAELFSPADRRYRYPFINCTHCGPRYTLTRCLPYDRAHTSLATFPLCPACADEYQNPADRRFHAEPTACPVCGPKIWLEDAHGPVPSDDAIATTLARLHAGEIVAIKGLGGFHLACDARNDDAVAALRERKQRDAKPFALMAANLDSVATWIEADAAEAALLNSRARPIVLLHKKPGANAGLPGIAPGLSWLGVMRPYTPLHWLLWHEAAGRPSGTAWMEAPQDLLLVMTSANPGGEPLVIDNTEARSRLADIADTFLLHDRDIVVRCDDSVLRQTASGAQFIRRARGYTPQAIPLAHAGPPVLALGGYFKNTVCVTRRQEAFVSQHIGSLDNPASCAMQDEIITHLLHILDVQPCCIAHDLHPDFYSTRAAHLLAAQWGVPTLAVQHHHAHIAAVLAEHRFTGPVLGLAMDGVGLGSDGGAWGGELLRIDGAAFARLGHLAPLRLPGGDKAAREPWRMAASVLFALGEGTQIVTRFAAQAAATQLLSLLERGTHCPPTSSLGRHFDAAAGLLGLCPIQAFEGQAAMQLEALAETADPPLHWPESYHITADNQLDLLPLLAHLVPAQETKLAAARFHASLIQALCDWTLATAAAHNLNHVVLAGGCFLNQRLSQGLRQRLTACGLHVLEAQQLPPNDGGLALGQAWIAQQTAV